VLVLLFSVRTVSRNRDWKDGMTLWTSVLQNAPQCARAHDNLGTEYLNRKDYQRALSHYQQAVSIRPEGAMFHNNLGMAYGAIGDLSNSEKEFRKAIALNNRLARPYNNLGTVLYFKGEYDTASRLFSYSSKLEPGILDKMGPLRAMVFYCDAKQMLKKGLIDAAIMKLVQEFRAKPDFSDAKQDLVNILKKKGDNETTQKVLRYVDSIQRKNTQTIQ
jgi:Tfp pilus assembly protein PilF